MKIILIRQAEADTAKACVKRGSARGYRVYTGTSPEAAETAALLFELPDPPEATALLDAALLDTARDHEAAWLRRAKWAFGSCGKETLQRARAFLDRIEQEDRDCIAVCGGAMLAMLKPLLRLRGYVLEGRELIPRPLDRIRATKASQHCGGCHHNCLLSAPKCQIGQNKAKERGLQWTESSKKACHPERSEG